MSYSIVQQTSSGSGGGGGGGGFSATSVLDTQRVFLDTVANTIQTALAPSNSQYVSLMNLTNDFVRVTFNFTTVWAGNRMVLLPPNGSTYVKNNNNFETIVSVDFQAVNHAAGASGSIAGMGALASATIGGFLIVTFGQN